ncbi:MAG: hypothetical protein QOK14_1510 [Frankiaceae bacterium]|nr:hypothetical protein [Frankiaceae bacterium]
MLDTGATTELVVVDLDRHEVRTPVVAEYDEDDLLMAVPEGGAVHLALIYDPQASVVITAVTRAEGTAHVHGEVEMTTAGAADLHRRTGGAAGPDDAWLVVRIVPTQVEFRD